MIKYLLKHSIVIFCLCPVMLFAHSLSATQSLQTRLDALKTYQANFTQTTVADHQVTGHANGKLSIQRPWHLRWTVDKPTKQVLIVNGNTLWNYNPDLAQATKQILNDQQRQNAAMLLASDGSIAQQFNVIESTASQKPLVTQYQLTPKMSSPVSHIILNFSKQGLVSMQTTNHLGQINHYQFSQIKVNQTINASEFTFTPPKGVDVLEAGRAYGAR